MDLRPLRAQVLMRLIEAAPPGEAPTNEEIEAVCRTLVLCAEGAMIEAYIRVQPEGWDLIADGFEAVEGLLGEELQLLQQEVRRRAGMDPEGYHGRVINEFVRGQPPSAWLAQQEG